MKNSFSLPVVAMALGVLIVASPSIALQTASVDAEQQSLSRSRAEAVSDADFDFVRWLAAQETILGQVESNIAASETQEFQYPINDLRADASLLQNNIARVLSAAEEAHVLRDGGVRHDFNVKDFGAIGDGVANDGPAIRRAVAEAKKHPWSRVFLPSGRYYIADADPVRITQPQYRDSTIDGSILPKDILALPAHLMIENATNLTVEGAGVDQTEIILGRNDIPGIQIANSLHTIIRDLSVDYANLPFSQGIVTEIANATSVRFQVDEGFPEPTASHLKSNFQVVRFFEESPEFGVVLHSQASTYYMVDSVTKEADGVFVVNFRTPLPEPGRDAQMLSTGDRIVFYGRWRQLYSPLKFSTSRNCGAIEVDIYAGPSVAINPEMNDLILIDECRIIPKPGTNRIASTNADGVFATANRVGPWLNGNTIRQNGDDYFNFLGVTAPMHNAGQGRIEINRSKNQVLGTFRPGDRLRLLDGMDYQTKQELMVRTSSLEKRDGELIAVVEVDGLIPQSVKTAIAGSSSEIPDYFVNLDVQNHGSVVTDNEFINGFRMMFRCSNALVENNRIVTRFSRGNTVHFGLRRYGHGGESWAANNILIRQNLFDVSSDWPIFHAPFNRISKVVNHGIHLHQNDFISPHLKANDDLKDGFDPELCENITFKKNSFNRMK